MSGESTVHDYLRDPQAIYARSFRLVREATDLTGIAPQLQPLVIRIVHACAIPEVVQHLQWSEGVETAAWSALGEGATVLADCEMVVNGIIRRRLPAENSVICTLNDAQVPALAKQLQNTRSAAALELWREHLANAVVVFGNAPTALFRLLEIMRETAVRPRAILGFPVGFVGAAESKRALVNFAIEAEVPFITLHGRLGGSAIAAAAVNGLASCHE